MTSGGRLPLTALPGHMWTVRWIACGKCDHHEPITPIVEPTPSRQAEANGWRRLAPLGWLCPACASLYQADQAQACATHRRRFPPQGASPNHKSIAEPVQPMELE